MKYSLKSGQHFKTKEEPKTTPDEDEMSPDTEEQNCMSPEDPMDLCEALDFHIQFHPIFAKWTGSLAAALFLSQVLFWSRRYAKTREGWFYKTIEEWTRDTGLTRQQQKRARKRLLELDLIEERKEGVPPKIYFRLSEKIAGAKLILQSVRNAPDNRCETRQTIGAFRTNLTRNNNTNKLTASPAPGAGGGILGKLGEGKVMAKIKEFRQLIKDRTGKTYTDHIVQKRWRTISEQFIQNQLKGDQDRFLRLLDWYMENIDGEYIPECGSIPRFCEKFRQIEKARIRATGEPTLERENAITVVDTGKTVHITGIPDEDEEVW